MTMDAELRPGIHRRFSCATAMYWGYATLEESSPQGAAAAATSWGQDVPHGAAVSRLLEQGSFQGHSGFREIVP